MDPLSITTGCFALLSVISTATNFATNFVVGCREARNDIAAVSRELSDLDITLHILKHGAEANELNQLPEDLRRHIHDIMTSCTTVLTDLEALLRKYQGPGLNRAKWALSGRKEAEKIRVSLESHKRALGLVVEATSLRMINVIAADTSNVIRDTATIKESTTKIVEQLAKQDKILQQIAWDHAVLTQRSQAAEGKVMVMDKYFQSLTEYAGSVCGDSVSEDVAEKMHVQSAVGSSGSDTLVNTLEPSSILSEETADFMTLVIGNTHRLVVPAEGSSNKHLWTFYLLTSGPEIIEEVRVQLHQTFTPPYLVLRSPPYEITRTGWGYFLIGVEVVLKQGYRWPKANGMVLPLEWTLNFDSMGNSVSHDYAIIVQA